MSLLTVQQLELHMCCNLNCYHQVTSVAVSFILRFIHKDVVGEKLRGKQGNGPSFAIFPAFLRMCGYNGGYANS